MAAWLREPGLLCLADLAYMHAATSERFQAVACVEVSHFPVTKGVIGPGLQEPSYGDSAINYNRATAEEVLAELGIVGPRSHLPQDAGFIAGVGDGLWHAPFAKGWEVPDNAGSVADKLSGSYTLLGRGAGLNGEFRLSAWLHPEFWQQGAAWQVPLAEVGALPGVLVELPEPRSIKHQHRITESLAESAANIYPRLQSVAFAVHNSPYLIKEMSFGFDVEEYRGEAATLAGAYADLQPTGAAWSEPGFLNGTGAYYYCRIGGGSGGADYFVETYTSRRKRAVFTPGWNPALYDPASDYCLVRAARVVCSVALSLPGFYLDGLSVTSRADVSAQLLARMGAPPFVAAPSAKLFTLELEPPQEEDPWYPCWSVLLPEISPAPIMVSDNPVDFGSFSIEFKLHHLVVDFNFETYTPEQWQEGYPEGAIVWDNREDAP